MIKSGFKKQSEYNQRTSRGFTLIQMMVTIAIMSVLLTITITALISLMKKNQSVTLQALHRRNLNRFSAQFREDIHQAKEVFILKEDNESGIVINKTNDEKTEYRTNKHSVIRNNENKEGIKSRENFRFMSETEIEFSKEETLFLNVTFRAPYTAREAEPLPKGYSPKNSVEITAQIARDLRFQRPPQNSPEDK